MQVAELTNFSKHLVDGQEAAAAEFGIKRLESLGYTNVERQCQRSYRREETEVAPDGLISSKEAGLYIEAKTYLSSTQQVEQLIINMQRLG